MSVQLSPQETVIVTHILKENLQPNSQAWVFGSRAGQAIKKHSDLDLAINQNNQALSLTDLAKLREAFDESPLPYKVDMVDMNNVTPEFRRLIEKQAKPFNF